MTQDIETEGLFPIRTVAQLTGVNPITLRAWERRHGLIRPVRTPKGHRLYTAQDVDTIQQVLKLLDQGMSIGQVPQVMLKKPPANGAEPLPASLAMDAGWQELFQLSLARLDEAVLERLQAQALSFASPDALLESYLLPLLDQLALSRLQDAALDAQFHLLQQRVLGMLLARLRIQPISMGGLLLASLPPERGLFALARAAFVLLRAGVPVHVLGSGVQANALLAAARQWHVRGVLLWQDHAVPPAVWGTQWPILQQSKLALGLAGVQAEVLKEHVSGARMHLDGLAGWVEFARALQRGEA